MSSAGGGNPTENLRHITIHYDSCELDVNQGVSIKIFDLVPTWEIQSLKNTTDDS